MAEIRAMIIHATQNKYETNNKKKTEPSMHSDRNACDMHIIPVTSHYACEQVKFIIQPFQFKTCFIPESATKNN